MKIIIFGLFFLMAIQPNTKCFSQEKDSMVLINIPKITFFNPGISYEKRIANFQSLYAQLFLNTSFSLGYSDSWGATSSISFNPAATLQYRYYYNARTRAGNGKNIKMNNLNYISVITETSIITEKIFLVDHVKKEHSALNKFSIAWGLQRNYKSRFSLDLNFGPCYFFGKVTSENNAGELTTKNEDEFTIAGQINLGFWLNKRNRN
jgi:hypothetical protein